MSFMAKLLKVYQWKNLGTEEALIYINNYLHAISKKKNFSFILVLGKSIRFNQ